MKMKMLLCQPMSEKAGKTSEFNDWTHWLSDPADEFPISVASNRSIDD